MRPIIVNGDAWRVVRVPAGHPSLVDRTGNPRIATTDQASMTISIAMDIVPPQLDRVLLHEVAHAVTMSYGLLEPLRVIIPRELWVLVEEWSVQLLETYSIEAMTLASESLGRPLCIRGRCIEAG